MREYTILAAASVLIAIVCDLTAGTKLMLRKHFWVFWAVMFILIFIVNGFLTWRPVVIYGENAYLGVRIFTIPVEDFLFGFSLITLNLVIWERYSRKHNTGTALKD